MCSHFIYIPQDALNEIIAEVERNLREKKYANVSAEYQEAFPKSNVPIILPAYGRMETAVMQWGYPSTQQKNVVYNTRADTALSGLGAKTNMWTASLRNRRCVIPTCGFFEPHDTEKAISPKTGKEIRQQYRFGLPGTNFVFMAGIYENNHFSMLTTDPNRWMKDIHPRMPLIISPAEFDQWLHGDYETLLQPGARNHIELITQNAS